MRFRKPHKVLKQPKSSIIMHLRELFLRHVAQTSDIPLGLEIEHAEGSWLYDTSGKKYLDFIGGISVSSIGHRHPAVVEAIKAQTDKYLHTLVYGEYAMSPQVELATELAKSLDPPALFTEGELASRPALDSIFFTNSGSEATEGAMKLAKRFTGRYEIIACRRAYHGSTQGAASLMWPKDFTQAYHPLLPGIRHIDFNDVESLELISEKTACVIVEPVQAEAGVLPPNLQFLSSLRKRCDETDTLLVFDEIQTGFGRTGSFWAFEQLGVVPDIILMAKAMGGGMPIGAFAAPREIMKVLGYDPPLGHITTFGGHPVSCAASLATLRFLKGSDTIANVKAKEDLLRSKLIHPKIKELRSAGMLMAIEVGNFEQLRKVQMAALGKGVITDWFLFNDRSLRIAPPLTIADEEIEFACNVLLECLDES
jgi:acetylornithine/succinyldiaminopimelate/putrescine aminotransferase